MLKSLSPCSTFIAPSLAVLKTDVEFALLLESRKCLSSSSCWSIASSKSSSELDELSASSMSNRSRLRMLLLVAAGETSPIDNLAVCCCCGGWVCCWEEVEIVAVVAATSAALLAASCCSRFCLRHLARRFLNQTCGDIKIIEMTELVST